MADSTGLLEGLLRMLCVRMPKEISDPVVRRAGVHTPADGAVKVDAIAKAGMFEALPVFSQVSREEMLTLTGIVSEANVVSGAQIFLETDSPALHLLISGSISLESTEDGSVMTAGAGDAVGLYQMLAGIPLIRHARCLEDTRFLRVDREDLLDLLMQRPDLRRQLLGSLFRSNWNVAGGIAADYVSRERGRNSGTSITVYEIRRDCSGSDSDPGGTVGTQTHFVHRLLVVASARIAHPEFATGDWAQDACRLELIDLR